MAKSQVVVKLSNDVASAHYTTNTPRSLRAVLKTAKLYNFNLEVVQGQDLCWVLQQIKNEYHSTQLHA
jgi:hypothetical protein